MTCRSRSARFSIVVLSNGSVGPWQEGWWRLAAAGIAIARAFVSFLFEHIRTPRFGLLRPLPIIVASPKGYRIGSIDLHVDLARPRDP